MASSHDQLIQFNSTTAQCATVLFIVKEVFHLSKGNYVVKDKEDNIISKVEGAFLTLHGRRVLRNSAGNPILTLRRMVRFLTFFYPSNT